MHRIARTLATLATLATAVAGATLTLAATTAWADQGCAKPSIAAQAAKGVAHRTAAGKTATERAALPDKANAAKAAAESSEGAPVDHEREVWRHQGVG